MTKVRKKFAAAVGIKPKKMTTNNVLGSGIGGGPSTINATGMTIAAERISKTVDNPMVSTAGNLRIRIEFNP